MEIVKRMLCLLLLLSPALLSPARGMTEAGMRGVILSSGNPMAGIYRSTEDGAMVAMVPSGDGDELVVLAVEAATPAVRPGTEIDRKSVV